MTVSFITPGLLDLENVFTFGVSAKDTENPIGFFGTGLKFAVATLLRTGHKIKIFTGTQWCEFRTEDRHFRGKDFKHVWLDDKPLNFTTDLGKTWEPWMAFRELHSNTLDEKGKTLPIDCVPSKICDAHKPCSIIVVEGAGIDQAMQDIGLIFCDSPIIDSNEKMEIRSGKSKHIYYRGVRVGKLPKEALFTYNILGQEDLTEDRTLKYEWYIYGVIAQQTAKLSNVHFLQRVLTAPDGTFEHTFDFDNATPKEPFIKVVKECYRDAFLSASARKLARTLNFFVEDEVPLDEIQQQQLARAAQFLLKIGFDVSEYPIKIMKLHGAMGQAKNGTIYIDPIAFRMGTKQLAGTLFEEWFHLSEGCRDETRLMQNFLIDTIMSMGEKLTGSPL